MTSDFDELEAMVMADAEKAYSETVIDHAMKPRNVGDIQDADGFAQVTGPCGDTIELWIQVRNETVARASFQSNGCAATIACGSIVTEMIKGKGVAEARKVQQNDILEALGGLPEGNKHCALLAASTLREAMNDYLTMKKEPWKKAYRNR
jgi:nitrogen fixation NifU-like protein